MGSDEVGEPVCTVGAWEGDRDGIDVVTSSVGAAVGDAVVPDEARLSIICAIISGMNNGASGLYTFKVVGERDDVPLNVTNDEVDEARQFNHTNEIRKPSGKAILKQNKKDG